MYATGWCPRGVQISLHIRRGGGVFQSKLWSSQIWSLPFGGGGYFGVNFGHLKSEVFHWGGGLFQSKLWSSQIWSFPWGGGYFGVNFGHLKSEVFHWGGGAFWSEVPESPFLENLDKNFLFEVNCTETCLCITDSLSHTTYVETNQIFNWLVLSHRVFD